jgi:hypothetical protein
MVRDLGRREMSRAMGDGVVFNSSVAHRASHIASRVDVVASSPRRPSRVVLGVVAGAVASVDVERARTTEN